MSSSRPFAYNPIPPNSAISGTLQVGDLAVGVDTNLNYTGNVGGVQWWMGPDEELGYVITQSVPSLNQPNPLGISAGVGFFRSEFLTESSFISASNLISGQSFADGNAASTWLTSNGYWNSWVLVTPTPTPTITITPSPTPTITITPSPTPTITITPSPTLTPTVTITPSPSITPTPTPTPPSLESFVIGTGLNETPNTIQIQSDGKILVGGTFTSYSGVSRNYIIRLNSDGSVDNTFTIGTGFNIEITISQIQSDGKILVGGFFTSYSGVSRNRIIRLNSDGSVDNTFTIGTGFNDYVSNIQIQSDGKILMGGGFTSYSGVSRNYIIRLNSDGSVDNTFTIGTGFDNLVTTTQIQSDGKILVGGLFTSYSGISSNYIIRLNSDGSVDNTFTIGTGFNDLVDTIQIQSDGKILVGGFFTSYSGISRNYIIRLNSDGSVDNTFTIGTGFGGGSPDTIQIQSDGKILVGGLFTSYSGISSNYIIRLNSDGSVDNTFTIGTGFDNLVSNIRIQSDGKILMGGFFTSYSGVSYNRIIRLNSDGSSNTIS
jgi:uncharacterized delta-60 repeat protein